MRLLCSTAILTATGDVCRPLPVLGARRRARRLAHYLGTDGEGTAHYFDWYSRELALIEADQEATLTLDETPFDTLRGWVEYTRQERGWAAEPRISSAITGQLKGAVARTEL